MASTREVASWLAAWVLPSRDWQRGVTSEGTLSMEAWTRCVDVWSCSRVESSSAASALKFAQSDSSFSADSSVSTAATCEDSFETVD